MEVKFLVDTMCGRCSRWLRILGYDAEWVKPKERSLLLLRCLREVRVLVTRDHRFEKTRGIQKILLRSDKILDQVSEITRGLKLKPDRNLYFHRCTFCNTLLRKVQKETIRSKVPPYVYQNCEPFYSCQVCQRIYWAGTHRKLFADLIAGHLIEGQPTQDQKLEGK